MENEIKAESVATFTNDEEGTAAHVTIGIYDGRFHVAYQDLDSGFYLPVVHIVDDKAVAIAKAKKFVKAVA